MATKTKEQSNGTATLQDLKQAGEVDKQRRANECLAAINQALTDNNCRLVPIFTAVNGDVIQRVEVVANE